MQPSVSDTSVYDWRGAIDVRDVVVLARLGERSGGDEQLHGAWLEAHQIAGLLGWELRCIVPIQRDAAGHEWSVIAAHAPLGLNCGRPMGEAELEQRRFVEAHGVTPVDALRLVGALIARDGA